MEFEADPVKAAQNFKKHKVSFEEAASIFGDSMELTFADPTILLARCAGCRLVCLAEGEFLQ